MSHTDKDEDYIQNLLTAVKCLAKRAERERRKKEFFCKKAEELEKYLEATVRVIAYYENELAAYGALEDCEADMSAGASTINGYWRSLFFKSLRYNNTNH